MANVPYFTGNLGPILAITKTKAETVTREMYGRGVTFKTEYGYNSIPDHSNLKCVDFMTTNSKPSGTGAGDKLAAYLIEDRTRLGVYLIIWNHRIWRSYAHTDKYGYHAPGTWAPYYGTANPHTDHVHVQFTSSAVRGEVKASAPAKPKPKAKGPIRVYAGPQAGKDYEDLRTVSVAQTNKYRATGQFSRNVWYVQEWLRLCGYRGHATGHWDKATQDQYDRFRRAHGYKGADAEGTVGLSSLTDLRKRARHYAKFADKGLREGL